MKPVRINRLQSIAWLMVTVVAIGLAQGCAARFNSGVVRNEIVRQQGTEPAGLYELNLGRFTTGLLKRVLTDDSGQVPFRGLAELQLAVFDTDGQDGPAIDVTLMNTRGWEPVVKILDGRRSAMVLVRNLNGFTDTGPLDGATIGDLVVVAAGDRKVVFGRLEGALDAKLPEALGEAFRSGGTQELSEVFRKFSADE